MATTSLLACRGLGLLAVQLAFALFLFLFSATSILPLGCEAAALAPEDLRVLPEDIVKQIEELGSLSDTVPPSITRILYSENDVRAREYVKGLMTKAGLSVREDPIGNIYGRLEGEDPSLPAVVSGSHTDAIPQSGKYDGVLGVLGAIEALRALKESGVKLKRSVEALMFTSEEPTRFGLSCIGSRAMCGRLDQSTLDSLRDANGTSFLDACHSANYGKGLSTAQILEQSFITKGGIHAFVELHIEQGPLLEADTLDIGVVTAIAAPASLEVSLHGNGGHAGALLMPFRKVSRLIRSLFNPH